MDVVQFQAGREAQINGKPRDGRRSADWLDGWDMEEAVVPLTAWHVTEAVKALIAKERA